MIDLAGARQAVYRVLKTNGPCFLRLCADDGALWATDLPRKAGGLEKVQEALGALNIRCELEPATRLWRMDWTPDEWRRRLAPLPEAAPAFPLQDKLHPAYALCRLLIAHPAPLAKQPRGDVRRMVKLACGAAGPLQNAIPAMHMEAARRLRVSETVAYDAGRVLAAWILDREQRTNA